MSRTPTTDAQGPQGGYTFEQSRLKDASFYTQFFSLSFLSVTAVFALTFAYTLYLLRGSHATGNTLTVAAALPLVFLFVLFHRSRVRQLIQNRSVDRRLLGEMASTLVAFTIGLCALAAMAAR